MAVIIFLYFSIEGVRQLVAEYKNKSCIHTDRWNAFRRRVNRSCWNQGNHVRHTDHRVKNYLVTVTVITRKKQIHALAVKFFNFLVVKIVIFLKIIYRRNNFIRCMHKLASGSRNKLHLCT